MRTDEAVDATNELGIGRAGWPYNRVPNDESRVREPERGIVEVHDFPIATTMGQRGVEPRTSRLSGVRSNHLSYWPCYSLPST